jgi:hypothetical protein
MRLVSQTSVQNIGAHRKGEDVKGAIRELTANLMRITRGAGRSQDLQRQAEKLLLAMEGFEAVTGTPPGFNELDAALQTEDVHPDFSQHGVENIADADAEATMIRGSLQAVASSLLGQRTQAAAGRSELYRGVNAIVAIRAERDRQNRAAVRAAKPVRRRTSSKRKPMTKPKAPANPWDSL